jgi:transposase-like protein
LAVRAKIVLACAEPGVVYERLASELGVTTMTVGAWRKRFAQARCAGLVDGRRSGRPKDELVVTEDEREQLTRWSRRAKTAYDAGRLVVRHGKFGKTRELALHPTTVDALRNYQRLRDRTAPATGTAALLVSTAGTRLLYCNIHHAFHRLVGLAGLPPRSGSCRPRIHDLRHSFAVAAMLDAYAAGQDGQTRLTLLSTWLGHVHPGSTYWYLSASPELMAVAGQRLETHLAAHLTTRSAGRP